ncbi:MAG: hypothetical protein CL866_01215 [Cycloclasticus sp.]|nr:hypothetical protein [Cycloclasticus sp.]MBG95479.1 hypothetical protein [Cycloclasticus sp.]|tara:strand:- start:755 stop:1783 length:1029 start_codon:yes stop_codon:yes gene_type:complete
MIENVKLQFYRISKMGYYRFGQDQPEFGSTSEIFEELSGWVRRDNKALSETCTYELEDGEDEYRAFCFDLVKNRLTGDFVIVTWNETSTNEGRVVTVDGTQSVGNADVNFTDLPEGSIPGYATYFWVVPEHDVFASIRFHHSLLIGKKSFDRYIKEFVAKFTSFVVTEETEDGVEILGYSDNNDEVYHLNADFKSYLYRKPGQIEYIKQNIDSVTKIIRKNELNPQVELHRTMWQKFLESIRVRPEENRLTDDIKIKYEIPFTPSEDEVDEIIAEWEENHESKWDDIGFKFESDPQIKWLSHSVAKDEFEIDVTRDNDEIVEAHSLLDALTESRNVYLRLIR